MNLTKSQRINFIKDISGRLRNDEWTDIDLVLKQFGLRTRNEWAGDKHSYVLEMIGEANDDDLTELAEHFGMEKPGAKGTDPAGREPLYWQDGKLKVFISHLTAHRQQAADIKAVLSRYGMSSFVAHNDIQPTAEWQIEIELALASCELLVALIHPNFVQSQWCDQEIGYALGRGIPVFTVRCGADPYGFVSRFQAFNGNGKEIQQIAKELFEAASLHKKLQAKMADILVDLFVNSGSYALAKSRINYLERLDVWDPSYSVRILKALKTNDQIGGSWGVPEQVNELIQKWT